MYRSARSLASALDRGGLSTPRPGCFTPEDSRYLTVQEAGWNSGPVRTGFEPPSRQNRSELLYQLRYPGRHKQSSTLLYCNIP